MTDAAIVEALISKLSVPGGRHLYGVVGSYQALDAFSRKLRDVRTLEGRRFPGPLSVNRHILDAIPDDVFHDLVSNEAKTPEPVAAHVGRAFEQFLRAKLQGKGLVVLGNFELIFAYHLELNLLRTMATDDDRVLLLLPGRREGGKVLLFSDDADVRYTLPTNLIAENHLWQLRAS
jgi:hypothetical protein